MRGSEQRSRGTAEKEDTFCQAIICSTGTRRRKRKPVVCVEKYCLAKSERTNCWMSDARSSGRIGYILCGSGGGDERRRSARGQEKGRTYPVLSVATGGPDGDRDGDGGGCWCWCCGAARSTKIGFPAAAFLTGLMSAVASARQADQRALRTGWGGCAPSFKMGAPIVLPRTVGPLRFGGVVGVAGVTGVAGAVDGSLSRSGWLAYPLSVDAVLVESGECGGVGVGVCVCACARSWTAAPRDWGGVRAGRYAADDLERGRAGESGSDARDSRPRRERVLRVEDLRATGAGAGE